MSFKLIQSSVPDRDNLTDLLGGIRTVNDVDVPTPGMLMATVSIAMSGLQQIMCGRLQKKFNLSSHELLANTAPVQVWR